MSSKIFSRMVWDFYAKNKRSFPWRETRNPYEILVSEIMLQQTQTHRVVPKYLGWLQQFPDIDALASAKLSEVLFAWNGLGYNRRAKFLWETAKLLLNMNKSEIPDNFKDLITLPGIGEYTANALLAFAYNKPTIVLETNIRTAIIHHFFAKQTEKVTDTQIKGVLAQVVDKKNPREWYYALMDYGSWLKSEGIDYFHQIKGHTKQSKFKGSERYVRGYLVRETLKIKELEIKAIIIPGYEQETIKKVANDLIQEGLLQASKPGYLSIV